MNVSTLLTVSPDVVEYFRDFLGYSGLICACGKYTWQELWDEVV